MNEQTHPLTAAAPGDIVARDKRYIWHPYTQHGTETDPLVVARAKGASLFDADGREILDMISSWWTCTHGHAHPKINAAIARQAETIEHVMFAGFTHAPAVDLAETLASLLPGDLNRVFYSDDGSTSVEVAIKIAYQSWINRGETRRTLIAFEGGYHGDTLGAMSVGRSSQMFGAFKDLMCDVRVVPFPATFDGDDAVDEREAAALSALEATLSGGKDTIAAMIIEPMMQGSAGIRFCRPGFLARMVEMARAAGVVVIFDEVATGFGRTGRLFAMEHAGVTPDLVCLSKGLTGGYMPLAATVARDWLFDLFLGPDFDRALPHGHSFTANPLACSVALAALGLYAEEQTMERIAKINAAHRTMLDVLAARPDVSRQRVLGPVLAFELNEGGAYQSEASRKLRAWYIANGFNIRPIGSTVYLMPPYCITDEELFRAYAGMIEGLDRLGSGSL
ncbi:adenosylmethionine--8-amino-7-oxononanoate transaminase [Methyloceanibacter sp.]|uniref:adenosylmethionine--8-amino-7-oxononanoate transaminase n=1 Tax=Methyloceanibacter sp. TaxID=1965321 RepID=UPI002BDF1018|nr:adenosylmethionine--8-amino-7-oxononanoate transaminase [Methyloceanibacter sp.]HML92558.1 adenosylmethionine--8-amino-7-oxononanoate transaminase [Methyloceanibacter sp.]